MTTKKEQPDLQNLRRDIRYKKGLEELEGLFVEADMMLTQDLNDENNLKYLFNQLEVGVDIPNDGNQSNYHSYIGHLIDRKQFEKLRDADEDKLRFNILMFIIVPELHKRYRKELSIEGRPNNGIDRFFKNLGQELYPVAEAAIKYAVSESTLRQIKRHDKYGNIKGKARLKTINGRLHLYRDPPK